MSSIRFSKHLLKNAYCDLIFLLDRNYPKKSALEFVSNHYVLEKKYRNILNRTAFPIDTVRIIKKNLVNVPDQIKGKTIHIDAYNQLTTFFTIFNHEPVFICRDGMLRDIFSSLHSKNELMINNELISLFLNTIMRLEPKKVVFYFDQQRSHSKKHARLISSFLDEFNQEGSSFVHNAVDWSLKHQTDDIIFTHDTVILTKASQCFDFSMWVFNLEFSNNLSHPLSIDFQSITCD
ncbi:MAG: DUF434 domain-containing protein [Candidatus Hodarchaeales archaeon]|jgi:hypothetical protein